MRCGRYTLSSGYEAPKTSHACVELPATLCAVPVPCSIWGSEDASQELVEGAVYKVSLLTPDAKSRR